MKSFVVVLVLCLAGIALADDSYWCDGAEKQETLTASLTALYLNTEETSWTHAHLWGSAECPCGWYGVDCVSDGNSTVRLNLDGNGIYGNLNSQFCANIYSLINLSNNNFFQTVVSCLGSMTKLVSLRLDNNSFQGLLPEELGNLSNLKTFSIQNNTLAGPFPDYLQCPDDFFKNSVKVTLSDNDFWCPSPAWCDDEDESSLECGCVAEPSDECTLINKMACNSELVCCYENSWSVTCDDLVDKTDVDCSDYSVPECKEKKDDGNSYVFWYILLGGVLLVVVIAIGWAIVWAFKFYNKDWRLSNVVSRLVKREDTEEYKKDDDDLYYDGVPPRSSLDYDL